MELHNSFNEPSEGSAESSGETNEHMKHYKIISEAAEQQIKESLETSEIYRTDMENNLREGEAREAVLIDELSDLETVCSELRESAKQLEAAHVDDLTQRGVELQYTKNLLKEAQANLALLEGKEAMAKEDIVLYERVAQETQDMYERVAQETQDMYEREVLEHSRTVEGFCRSKDELSALKVKLQTAEQQATEQVFKLEECGKN